MAKKASKKKTSQKKYATKRNLMILFVVLFIISVAVGLIYLNHQSAIDKDREQFMQAKSDLRALYGEIVAEVGRPTAHKSVQSCEYTNSEFTKGYLYCGVREYMFYEGDSDMSKAKAEKITAAIEGFPKTTYSQKVRDVKTNELASLDFSLASINRCGSQYVLSERADDKSTYQDFLFPRAEGLSIELYCQKAAKYEYFPVVSQ